MKKCSNCGKTKKLSEFVKNIHAKDGYTYECCVCKRIRNKKRTPTQRNTEYTRYAKYEKNRMLIKKYGISKKEYDEMLVKQDYLCKICGKHQSESNKGLAVDHCHDTGRVRGLLCNSCNLAIGQLHHNVTILKKAIEYLGA